jgi:hypothetical protein
MRVLTALVISLLCVLPLAAQRGWITTDPVTAVGPTSPEASLGPGNVIVIVTPNVGAGSTCQYRMEKSSDKKTWTTVIAARACTSAINQPVTATWFRAYVTSFTGTSPVTFTIHAQN